MTTREIEQVLERYYEGDTTLKEEQLLREYFNGANVADHLKSHQPLFRYFSASASESPAREPLVVSIAPVRHKILYISSLAAGVLLIVGLFFTFLNNQSARNRTLANNHEMQMAYLQAEDALMLVSGNLNNGLHLVRKLSTFDKALNDMQRIGKFSQYQPLIINPDETQKQSINNK